MGYIKPPCNHSECIVWIGKYTDMTWKNMTGGIEGRKGGRKESKVITIDIISLVPTFYPLRPYSNPKIYTEKK